MTYNEGGSQGEDYIADDRFFERLLTWLEGISSATDTRVVLDNVPVGNSVYRTIDNTDFHFRDAWTEWILGDDGFDNLIALRDAGVIGIVFGVDGDATNSTCPCDAAEDGVTNPGDTASGPPRPTTTVATSPSGSMPMRQPAACRSDMLCGWHCTTSSRISGPRSARRSSTTRSPSAPRSTTSSPRVPRRPAR